MQGSECEFQGSRFRVEGLGLIVAVSAFKSQGVVFRV